MKTPHKHAALIKQWADGNEVQWRLRDAGINPTEWINVNESGFPGWDCGTIIFRVKPEPTPDVVKYVCLDIDCATRVTARSNYFSDFAHRCDNLMLVFDGETRELKDAQVLAQE